jgi:hypothetical protein
VSIADVVPTVLDWLGLAHERPTGRSLAPCVRGGPDDDLTGLARIDLGPRSAGVRTSRASILVLDGPARLFDLTADPFEQHPLPAAGDPRTERLWRVLPRPLEMPFGAGIPLAPFDDEVRGRLLRMGEPDPTAAAPR